MGRAILRSKRTVAMLVIGAAIILVVAITISLNLARTEPRAFTITTATAGAL